MRDGMYGAMSQRKSVRTALSCPPHWGLPRRELIGICESPCAEVHPFCYKAQGSHHEQCHVACKEHGKERCPDCKELLLQKEKCRVLMEASPGTYHWDGTDCIKTEKLFPPSGACGYKCDECGLRYEQKDNYFEGRRVGPSLSHHKELCHSESPQPIKCQHLDVGNPCNNRESTDNG